MIVPCADNVRRNRRTTTTAEAPRAMPAHRGGPLGDIAPANDHGVSLCFLCSSYWLSGMQKLQVALPCVHLVKYKGGLSLGHSV